MSTFTTAEQPLRITRGRAGSFPMRWQSPSSAAINIAGFGITASLTWLRVSKALTVTRPDDAAGRFSVRWTDADVATLAEGRVAELRVRIVDTAGENHDFLLPIDGEIP